MRKGDHVRILRGEFAGQTATIVKECSTIFADYVYVLLDRRGRERTDKRRMVAKKDLELAAEVANERG